MSWQRTRRGARRKLPQRKRGLPTLNPSVHSEEDLFKLDVNRELASYRVEIAVSTKRSTQQRSGRETITRPQSARATSRTSSRTGRYMRRPQSAITPTRKAMQMQRPRSAMARSPKYSFGRRDRSISPVKETIAWKPVIRRKPFLKTAKEAITFEKPEPGLVGAIPTKSETAKNRKQVADSEAKMKEMGNNVQTSQDVIEFFALYGDAPNLNPKFVHLVPAPEVGGIFRPYDLTVTCKSKAQSTPINFTMSSSGVVRIMHGEPSERLTLSEWTRQSTIFNAMSNIKFFKNFLIAGSFRDWKESVRFRRYSQKKRLLASKSFFARTTFSKPLYRIRQHLGDLLHVPVMEMHFNKAVNIYDFSSIQIQSIDKARKDYEEITSQAYSAVWALYEKLCVEVDKTRLELEEVPTSIGAMQRGTRSLVKMKELRILRKRNYGKACHEKAMLLNFARLIDYQTVDYLMEIMMDTSQRFLEALCSSQENKFDINIVFDGRRLGFEPNQGTLGACVSSVLQKVFDAIEKVPRLTNTQRFADVIQEEVERRRKKAIKSTLSLQTEPKNYIAMNMVLEPSGPTEDHEFTGRAKPISPAEIVIELPDFQGPVMRELTRGESAMNTELGRLKVIGGKNFLFGTVLLVRLRSVCPASQNDVLAALNEDYRKAELYLEEQFQEPLKLLLEQERFDMDMEQTKIFGENKIELDFSHKPKTMHFESRGSMAIPTPVEGLMVTGAARLVMKRTEQWLQVIDRISPLRDLRTLLVQSRQLLVKLNDSTQALKEQILKFISACAAERALQITSLAQHAAELVKIPKLDLHSFATFLYNLAAVYSQQPQIKFALQDVEVLYSLVEKWEKRVDPKLTRSLNGMKNAGSNMIGAVYKADNFHRTQLESMQKHLVQSSEKMHERCLKEHEKLQGDVFNQKKSHPRDILKLLESENGKINRIVTHSTQYLSYAKIFGIEEFAVSRKASNLLSRINNEAESQAVAAPGRPFLERRLIESAMEGLQLSYDHLVTLWVSVRELQKLKSLTFADKFVKQVAKMRPSAQFQARSLLNHFQHLHKNVQSQVTTNMVQEARKFHALMPTVELLCCRHLRKRHWERLFVKLNMVGLQDVDFSLDQIGSVLFDDSSNLEFIRELVAVATTEAGLEKSCFIIRQYWGSRVFTMDREHFYDHGKMQRAKEAQEEEENKNFRINTATSSSKNLAAAIRRAKKGSARPDRVGSEDFDDSMSVGSQRSSTGRSVSGRMSMSVATPRSTISTSRTGSSESIAKTMSGLSTMGPMLSTITSPTSSHPSTIQSVRSEMLRSDGGGEWDDTNEGSQEVFDEEDDEEGVPCAWTLMGDPDTETENRTNLVITRIMASLDNDIITLSTGLLSRHLTYEPRNQATIWKANLTRLRDTLSELLEFSWRWRRWYRIVRSPHIQKNFPEMEHATMSMNRRWRALLGRLSGTLPNEAIDPPKSAGYVMNVLHKSSRFPATLRESWRTVEELEAQVGALLMHMRQPTGDDVGGCPRLYFLSDVDLLDLMSRATHRHPEDGLNPHLSTLFPGVWKLLFGQQGRILGIAARLGGEQLMLEPPVESDDGPLQGWLRALDNGIQDALRQKMNIALGLGQSLCPTLRLLWPRTLVDTRIPANPALKAKEATPMDAFDTRHYIQRAAAQIPSQCVLIASDILFFRSLTSTTMRGSDVSMKDVYAQCHERITALLQVIRCTDSVHLHPSLRVFAGKGSSHFRPFMFAALMARLCHQRDIVNQFVSNNVTSPTQWLWSRQLRYEVDVSTEHDALYASNNKNGLSVVKLVVKQLNHVCMEYMYEYAGACTRMIRTSVRNRNVFGLYRWLSSPYGTILVGNRGVANRSNELLEEVCCTLGIPLFQQSCLGSDGQLFASKELPNIVERMVLGVAQTNAMCWFRSVHRLPTNVLSLFVQCYARVAEALIRETEYLSLRTLSPGGLADQANTRHQARISPTACAFALSTMQDSNQLQATRPAMLNEHFRPLHLTQSPDLEPLLQVALMSLGFRGKAVEPFLRVAPKVLKWFHDSSSEWPGVQRPHLSIPRLLHTIREKHVKMSLHCSEAQIMWLAFKEFLFKQAHAVQISSAEVASLVQAIVPPSVLKAELKYHESISKANGPEGGTAGLRGDWDRKRLVKGLYSSFGLVDSTSMADKIVDIGEALNINSGAFVGPKHVQMSLPEGQVVVLCGVGKTTALAILQLAIQIELSTDPKTVGLRHQLLPKRPNKKANNNKKNDSFPERKKTSPLESDFALLAKEISQKPEVIVRMVRCNPSSVLVEDMLGHHSHATGEWVDGFITRLVQAENRRNQFSTPGPTEEGADAAAGGVGGAERLIEKITFKLPKNKSRKPKQRTIVVLDTLCDGDEAAACHSQLISSLEGTRGETRMLLLPNCSTVPVPNTLGFAFETRDLSGAGPDILRHCMLVHLDANQLNERQLIERWARITTAKMNIKLEQMLDKYLHEQVRKAVMVDRAGIELKHDFRGLLAIKDLIQVQLFRVLDCVLDRHQRDNRLPLIQSFCRAFDSLLLAVVDAQTYNSTGLQLPSFLTEEIICRRVLMYALMWGVAACTPDITSARARVETLLHEEVCVHVLGSEQEARTLLLDDVEKANASLFDVKLNYRTCMFALWSQLDTVASVEHGHLLVPRTEVLATLNALRFLLLSERSLLEVGCLAGSHCLLTGEAGYGKTFVLEALQTECAVEDGHSPLGISDDLPPVFIRSGSRSWRHVGELVARSINGASSAVSQDRNRTMSGSKPCPLLIFVDDLCASVAPNTERVHQLLRSMMDALDVLPHTAAFLRGAGGDQRKALAEVTHDVVERTFHIRTGWPVRPGEDRSSGLHKSLPSKRGAGTAFSTVDAVHMGTETLTRVHTESRVATFVTSVDWNSRDRLHMRFRRHLTEVWLASPTEGSIFACATSMMSSNGWGCPIFEDEIPQPDVVQNWSGGGMMHRTATPHQAAAQNFESGVLHASVLLMSKVRVLFKPSPSKPFCNFNLRHLRALLSGIRMIDPPSMLEPDAVVQLWMHEACREFRDRFALSSDVNMFDSILRTVMQNVFRVRVDPSGVDRLVFGDFMERGDNARIPTTPNTPKQLNKYYPKRGKYAQVMNLSEAMLFECQRELPEVCAAYQKSYNLEYKYDELHLAFFPEAVTLLAHMCRAFRCRNSATADDRLTAPRGMVLCGPTGNGQASLCRLAAYMQNLELVEVPLAISRADSEQWRGMLKGTIMLALKSKRPVVLLVRPTDAESFLPLLDDLMPLIRGCLVHEWFDPQSASKLLHEMTMIDRRDLGEGNRAASTNRAWKHMEDVIHEKLRIVLSMDASTLQRCCTHAPSITSYFTMTCVSPLGNESLFEMAQKRMVTAIEDPGNRDFFQEIVFPHFAGEGGGSPGTDEDIGTQGPPSKDLIELVATSIAVVMVQMHVSAKSVAEGSRINEYKIVTQAETFMAFVEEVSAMIKGHNRYIIDRIKALHQSCQNMREIEQLRGSLKKQVKVLEQSIEDAGKELKSVKNKIAKTKIEMSALGDFTEDEKQELKELAVKVADFEIKVRKAEDDLPGFEAALEAIQDLDRPAIMQLRDVVNPRHQVVMTLEAVLVLLHGRKPTKWSESQTVINQEQFLRELRAYDVPNIDRPRLLFVSQYMNNPICEPDAVGAVGSAARALCEWVWAIYAADQASREMNKMRRQYEEMTDELKKRQKDKDYKRIKTNKLEEKIISLENATEDVKRKTASTRKQLAGTNARLTLARQLCEAFGEHSKTWVKSENMLKAGRQALLGTALLWCGEWCYCGTLDDKHRKKIMQKWLSDDCTGGDGVLAAPRDYSFEGFTREQVFQVRGLNEMRPLFPPDMCHESFLKKALVLCGRPSGQFPLILDPQGHAVKWLEEAFYDKSVVTTEYGSPQMMDEILESCATGRPQIVTGFPANFAVQRLAFKALLRRKMFDNGKRNCLHLQTEEVWVANHSIDESDFVSYSTDPPFMMFLICDTMHLPGAACFSKARVVDLTMSERSLRQDLLKRVAEAQDLSVQRRWQKYQHASAELKNRRVESENVILHLLSTTSASEALDNRGFCAEALAEKARYIQIETQLKDAIFAYKESREELNAWLPIAKLGAALYLAPRRLVVMQRRLAGRDRASAMANSCILWFHWTLFAEFIVAKLKMYECHPDNPKRKKEEEKPPPRGTRHGTPGRGSRPRTPAKKTDKEAAANKIKDDPLMQLEPLPRFLHHLIVQTWNYLSRGTPEHHHIFLALMVCHAVQRAMLGDEAKRGPTGVPDDDHTIFDALFPVSQKEFQKLIGCFGWRSAVALIQATAVALEHRMFSTTGAGSPSVTNAHIHALASAGPFLIGNRAAPLNLQEAVRAAQQDPLQSGVPPSVIELHPWMTLHAWRALSSLSRDFEGFNGVDVDLTTRESVPLWDKLVTAVNPQETVKDFEASWRSEPGGLTSAEQLLVLQAVRPDAVLPFLRSAANECVRETITTVEAIPHTKAAVAVGTLGSIAECDDEDSDNDAVLEPIAAMIGTAPEKFDAGLTDAVATSKPAAPIVVVAPDGDFMDWRAAVMAEVRAQAQRARSRGKGRARRTIKVKMLDLNDEYNAIEKAGQTISEARAAGSWVCLFFLRLGMTSKELKGLHELLQPLVDHKMMDATHKNYRLFVCCRWPRKKFDEKDTQAMLPLPADFMSRSTRVFMREPTGFRAALSSSEMLETRFDTPAIAQTRFTVSMVAAVLHYRQKSLQQRGNLHTWQDVAWTMGDMKASLTLIQNELKKSPSPAEILETTHRTLLHSTYGAHVSGRDWSALSVMLQGLWRTSKRNPAIKRQWSLQEAMMERDPDMRPQWEKGTLAVLQTSVNRLKMDDTVAEVCGLDKRATWLSNSEVVARLFNGLGEMHEYGKNGLDTDMYSTTANVCSWILNEVRNIGLNIRQERGQAAQQNITIGKKSPNLQKLNPRLKKLNPRRQRKSRMKSRRGQQQKPTRPRRRFVEQQQQRQQQRSSKSRPSRESPRDVRRELLQRSCQGEVLAVQRRIGRLRAQLNLLHSVLQGRRAMNESARVTLDALRRHRVPPGWDIIVSEDDSIASPDSIVGWTDILKRRSEFVEFWYTWGAPEAFWLAALSFPRQLLALPLTMRYRCSDVNILSIRLRTVVLWDLPSLTWERSDSSVWSLFLSGFTMKGARLDRQSNCLAPISVHVPAQHIPYLLVEAVSARAEDVPPVDIFPPAVPAHQRNAPGSNAQVIDSHDAEPAFYCCPVYVRPMDEEPKARGGGTIEMDEVLSVRLGCTLKHAPSFWTLQGIAIMGT